MWRDFLAWLADQGTAQNTAASTVSRLERLSSAYGDLATHYKVDRLARVLADLRYGMTDERAGRRNPSKVFIGGDLRNGLASLKNAVRLYERYMDEKGGHAPALGMVSATRHLRTATVTGPEAVPIEHLDGRDVLASATAAMNANLAELVARCSIWARPEVVAEITRSNPHAAWFPATRRMKNGEKRGELVEGARLDDNSNANLAIKLATFGRRGIKGFHACHVWPETCYDARYHTSIANLVLLPAALAGLSDHDEMVAACLQYRAFELYAWHPEEEPFPERPIGYPAAESWREAPPLSSAVQRAVGARKR